MADHLEVPLVKRQLTCLLQKKTYFHCSIYCITGLVSLYKAIGPAPILSGIKEQFIALRRFSPFRFSRNIEAQNYQLLHRRRKEDSDILEKIVLHYETVEIFFSNLQRIQLYLIQKCQCCLLCSADPSQIYLIGFSFSNSRLQIFNNVSSTDTQMPRGHKLCFSHQTLTIHLDIRYSSCAL